MQISMGVPDGMEDFNPTRSPSRLKSLASDLPKMGFRVKVLNSRSKGAWNRIYFLRSAPFDAPDEESIILKIPNQVALEKAIVIPYFTTRDFL